MQEKQLKEKIASVPIFRLILTEVLRQLEHLGYTNSFLICAEFKVPLARHRH